MLNVRLGDDHPYRKWLLTWLSLVMLLMVSYFVPSFFPRDVGWLVDFGLNGPLRQYFSLYRVVSQREGEREEKG